MSSSQKIESFKSTLLRWNGWLNRWWKFFTSRPTPSVSPQHPSHLDWTINQSKKSDWESREYWIGLRARFYFLFFALLSRFRFKVFPRTYSFKTRPSFKKRPSYSLPQSAEHPIEHTHDWELREHWIRLKVRVYGIFPHYSADSSSELFHEPTTFLQETTFPQPFLNWPSI